MCVTDRILITNHQPCIKLMLIAIQEMKNFTFVRFKQYFSQISIGNEPSADKNRLNLNNVNPIDKMH